MLAMLLQVHQYKFAAAQGYCAQVCDATTAQLYYYCRVHKIPAVIRLVMQKKIIKMQKPRNMRGFFAYKPGDSLQTIAFVNSHFYLGCNFISPTSVTGASADTTTSFFLVLA